MMQSPQCGWIPTSSEPPFPFSIICSLRSIFFSDANLVQCDRLRVGRGTASAEDAQGTPPQSDISPSVLIYKDTRIIWMDDMACC